MRALITVPHFHRRSDGARHGSEFMLAEERAAMVETTIQALFDMAGDESGLIDHRGGTGRLPVNALGRVEVEVVVCTVGDDHLLDRLDPSLGRRLHRQPAAGDPRMLPFGARDVLARNLGSGYDWYGLLEDDVLIADRWFFHKLRAATPNSGVVVLPNRYEADPRRPLRKLYGDGPARLVFGNPGHAALFEGETGYEIDWCGLPVRLRKVSNPHAGCFFLTADQMNAFARAPVFANREIHYVSPLETAVTWGLLT
ncbi:MAG: hypothetical protein K9G59_18820, partial [Caulobacter sp.]|nr:hypothetical protein [Caulobacter sp.]